MSRREMSVTPDSSVGTFVSPEMPMTSKDEPCCTYWGYVTPSETSWSASTAPMIGADARQRIFVVTSCVVSTGSAACAAVSDAITMNPEIRTNVVSNDKSLRTRMFVSPVGHL